MPYIPEIRRKAILKTLSKIETAGELNFAFTTLANEYVLRHGMSYQTFNDILGAFDGASKEFYRRLVAPYEDKKLFENGDVYNGHEQQAAPRYSAEKLRSEGVEL